MQWLNPNAFVSAVDPSTGACSSNCQFGNLGRNALRGPDFVWSDFYLTKWFQLREHLKLRLDAQVFNVFNHPNFGFRRLVMRGFRANLPRRRDSGRSPIPPRRRPDCSASGWAATVSPRMIAFQARLEF